MQRANVRRLAVLRWSLPLLALLPLAAGCSTASSAGGTSASAAASVFSGTVMDDPFAIPNGTLTTTEGKSYSFQNELGRDRLTLVYFGYTHCPDICPTTMADLASAMGQLSPDTRQRVQVVMVTSDPARDTPTALRTWLNRFDPSFTGLVGPIEKIVTIAKSVGIGIDPPHRNAAGDYLVEHGTRVLAFTPDGKAHVLYSKDTTPEQFVHDIPLLLSTYPKEKP
jgi:protein SCO1/2